MNGHSDLLKLLLDKKPNAEIRNNKNQTPIDVAKNDKVKKVLTDFLSIQSNKFTKVKIYNLCNLNEQKKKLIKKPLPHLASTPLFK